MSLTIPAEGRSPAIAAAAILGCAALVLLVHAASVAAMATVWWRSGTFAHGALVLPISAWLIWRARGELAATVPRSSWTGGLLVLAVSGIWAAGAVFEAPVVRQLAALACVPASIWMIFGWSTARAVLFPLLFAFFAVPTGEFLIPGMMDITARGAVTLLRFSGISVFRDGWLLVTPGGAFQVADACSGVRYLIAAIVTAALFGYLFYAAQKKRILFIGFVAFFAVLMNVVRAYIIICLAYLSDMRIAVGVDHFIYGWFFFGVLLAAVLGIGLRYADPPTALPVTASSLGRDAFTPHLVNHPGRFLAALVICMGLLVAGPAIDRAYQAGSLRTVAQQLPGLPEAMAGAPRDHVQAQAAWLRAMPGWQVQHGNYRRGSGDALQLHVYVREPGQQSGSDVMPLRELLADGVVLVSDAGVQVTGRRGVVTVRETHLLAGREELWVASWFVVGGRLTANPITAKLLEVRGQLTGKPVRPALVAVSIATKGLDQPQDRLHQVVSEFAGSGALCPGSGERPETGCEAFVGGRT